MSVRKVTLMYPNFNWVDSPNRTKWYAHPYNIGLLASMLEDKYEVNILDASMDNLSKENFAKIIQDTKPDVLGISLSTNEYMDTGLIAAEIAKKNNPETKTIVGGVGVTSNSEPLLKNPNIDGAVIGEGEYVFREFCDFLNGNGSFPKNGFLYKKENQLIGSGRVDFIQNLDALPLPAYHLVDFMKYATTIQRESVDRPRGTPYARIITSRGCPFHCCFCEVGSISGKKVRFRSLEKISEEIEWLIKDYGIKALSFDDDNLTVNKKRAKDLFKLMIDRKYNLNWNDPATAIFTLDDEMLDLMKESGCTYLGVAIENGNQRVLRDIIHKPVDLKMVKETVKKIKARGIDVAANFIVGFPGETWEEIRETFRYAEELDPDYCRFFIATPLPNTELYRIAKEQKILRDDFDFNKHNWTDGQINTPEFRHQDLKMLRAYEWDRINFPNQKKFKKIAQMFDVSDERLNEIRKDTLKNANP